MNETERQTSQTEFEKLKEIVCENFQIEEALVEHNIPTFYLKQHQETKQAFLKLLEMLKPMNLVAYLRRHNEKIVLKIFPKPPAKPSNTLVNWNNFCCWLFPIRGIYRPTDWRGNLYSGYYGYSWNP